MRYFSMTFQKVHFSYESQYVVSSMHLKKVITNEVLKPYNLFLFYKMSSVMVFFHLYFILIFLSSDVLYLNFTLIIILYLNYIFPVSLTSVVTCNRVSEIFNFRNLAIDLIHCKKLFAM